MLGNSFKVAAVAVLLAAAAGMSSANAEVKKSVFGKSEAGQDVALYTLKNAKGMEVGVTPWGATLVSLKVPDRNGKLSDVVLGFDTLDGYLGKHPFFGATVGRYGNRIAKGKFKLDGKEYTLPTNNGVNHLHGGPEGFNRKLWKARESQSRKGSAVVLTYTSEDGEQGYPGKLDVTVTYTLTNANELRIDYQATTDKPTVVNLTNHSYFNLAGEGDVLGHLVTIKATRFIPTDSGQIPTGEIRKVKNTPFDFTTPHTVGERINAQDEQLKLAKGYDHNWVLDGTPGTLRSVASVSEPKSGRVMEVLTTEPGLQFYTGNNLSGSIGGKSGKAYQKYAALCLETQHFPDSPNVTGFPSTVLRPGQRYRSTTVYRFSVEQ